MTFPSAERSRQTGPELLVLTAGPDSKTAVDPPLDKGVPVDVHRGRKVDFAGGSLAHWAGLGLDSRGFFDLAPPPPLHINRFPLFNFQFSILILFSLPEQPD
jgi:hypothetical protein